jgi:hypothetical protein
VTPQRISSRTMLVIAGILFAGAFLLGFVPQFRSASALRTEISGRDQRMQQLEREAKLLRARSAAGLLYLELTRRNYGIATQHATALFDHLRGMLPDSSPQTRSSIEKLLSQRDTLLAGIAKSEPAAVDLAQQMLDQLHQIQNP